MTIVEADAAGAVRHSNVYGGKAFILRADGMRIVGYVSPPLIPSMWTTVPEPHAYAKMLARLGLVGFGVRGRRGRPDRSRRASFGIGTCIPILWITKVSGLN